MLVQVTEPEFIQSLGEFTGDLLSGTCPNVPFHLRRPRIAHAQDAVHVELRVELPRSEWTALTRSNAALALAAVVRRFGAVRTPDGRRWFNVWFQLDPATGPQGLAADELVFEEWRGEWAFDLR